MNIPRYILASLEKSLQPSRAVMLLGARRVGKTTLIKQVLSNYKDKTVFYNCDDPKIRDQFTNISTEELKGLLKHIDLVVFDEAQRIKNIGLTLKLITDELPDKKLIVSGSSSLELSNQINEPLTGRKITFRLFPISFLELYQHLKYDDIKLDSYLDSFLRFGSYPSLFDLNSEQDKIDYLLELAQDYLYKDALEYQDIRNPEPLRRLLNALALQISQEVSYTELANLVGIDQKTVIRYIDLLEKSYVIFRLPAFSRNLRKEINKSRKIYFYDLGIRNALIRNFNPYNIRNDLGQAWENLLVSERQKRDLYKKLHKNYYFWRTYDQKEIDLIEDTGGKLTGFEFKWNKLISKIPKDFIDTYPNSKTEIVNNKSYIKFVT